MALKPLLSNLAPSRLVKVLLLSIMLLSPAWADFEPSPAQQLLAQMASANREINYRGIFTYEHGGVLKTIRVVHAVQDGKEKELLVHISGEENEVIRRGNSLDCQRLGDSLLRGAVPGMMTLNQKYLEDFYELYIKGKDRIAARSVTMLHIVPKDDFRYGYALGIDDETGLLLQAMLIGQNKRVLERFQFVDVQTQVDVKDAELQPTSTEHLTVAGVDASPCLDSKPVSAATRNWKTTWLPPGFMLAGHHVPDDETEQEVMLYTDGLAVFSVFVDAGDGAGLPQVQGQRGATVAYLARIGVDDRQYAVCVVGEIPAPTAKRVAYSLAPLK